MDHKIGPSISPPSVSSASGEIEMSESKWYRLNLDCYRHCIRKSCDENELPEHFVCLRGCLLTPSISMINLY